MEQLWQWLQEHRAELVGQYHQSLRQTLFSNRSEVRPAMLKQLAIAEAEALLGFSQQTDPAAAVERGRELCRVGLGEEAILHLGRTTRDFCLRCLPEELRPGAIETTDAYHSAVLRGYLEGFQEVILEEQERIRSALQRTLNRYTVQMEAAAEVAQAAASILELNKLLQVTADLIRERFQSDYVGIFLVDETGRWAALRAGTGQIGQEMVRRSQRLEVHGDSIVGLCIAHGKAHVTLDVDQEIARPEISPLPGIRSEIAVPLVGRGRVIGAIAIQCRRVAAFSEQDITALGIVANQLTNGVENARLFQERERRIVELATLNDIGRELSSALELDALLQAVYRRVSQVFNGSEFYVALCQDDSEEWGMAFHVKQGQQLPSSRHKISEGLTGYIIRERTPLLLPNTLKNIAFHEAMGIEFAGERAKSWMGAPLIAADQAVGVLSVQSYEQENLYGAQDLAVLTTIAAQAAIAIQNAHLFDEIRRFNAELEAMVAARTQQLQAEKGRLETLHAASTELTKTLDLDDILLKTVTLASRATGGCPAMILLYDPAGETLVCRAALDEGDAPRACQLPVALDKAETLRQVLAQREPLYFEDLEAGPEPQGLPPLPPETRSVVVIPLVAAERAVGIIQLNHPERGFFDQDQLRLLMTLGSEVATTIVNAELYGRVNEQAHRLAEMLSYQQGFISVVSHELRTPLTAILGYADLLGKVGGLSDTQQQCVDVIHSNVLRQMDLINDLTDISRLETGQVSLSPEPVSLPVLVNEVVQSARIEIERKRLRLKVQMPERLPRVYVDRKRIVQVLTNLVSNAYKYTREEGEIVISAHVADGHLQVDVRDSGVGISKQDQQKLFTRFFRADNALREQVGGTGLGLVISKSFVELHGGTMWVESELEAGSIFSFTLPLFGEEGS